MHSYGKRRLGLRKRILEPIPVEPEPIPEIEYIKIEPDSPVVVPKLIENNVKD